MQKIKCDAKTLRTPFIEHVIQRYHLPWQHLSAQLLQGLDAAQQQDFFSIYWRWLGQNESLLVETEALDWSLRLRLLRHTLLARLAMAELTHELTVQQSAQWLSSLARFCLQISYDAIYQQLQLKYGCPKSESGQPAFLAILLMGKLGGGELNFSSDIDLIFVYSHDGYTAVDERLVAGKSIRNQQFFVQLASQLSQALSQQTQHGLVFRVDHRLRPFGEDSLLANSLLYLSNYLTEQARDWERLAYAKADVFCTDESFRQCLHQRIKQFVFRRYADFGLLDALRHLTRQIATEKDWLSQQWGSHNLKYMPGGIRMLEFMLQVLQILYAKDYEPLQQPLGAFATIPLLSSIGVEQIMLHGLEDTLVFLRRLEHRLQMWQDQQTQQLPSATEVDQWHWLAVSMGCENVAELEQQLLTKTAKVVALFEQHLYADESLQAIALEELQVQSPQRIDALLEPLHVSNRLDFQQQLQSFLSSRKWRYASHEARRRFAKLMPLVLKRLAASALLLPNEGNATWLGLFHLFESILQRSAYISLLIERPALLAQLLQWSLTQPVLLQEIIDLPVLLESFWQGPVQQGELSRAVLRHQWQSLANHKMSEERALHKLREFKRVAFFKVSLLYHESRINAYQVSDLLTGVARQVVSAALQMAIKSVSADVHEVTLLRRAVLVLGYGKLGSFELGVRSDLDCIILYDDTGEQQLREWFETKALKIARRFKQNLSLKTIAGHCFEVDFRLRPDGTKGMMVCGIQQFQTYHQDRAWLWEKQALIKARSVAGSPLLARRFAQIRRHILLQPIEVSFLRQEMRQMLQRIAAQLDATDAQQWDIKHGKAGLVQIEFLMHYWVLHYAQQYPALLLRRSVSSIVDFALTQSLLHDPYQAILKRYFDLRQLLHEQQIKGLINPGMLPQSQLQQLGLQVSSQWVEEQLRQTIFAS